MKPSAKAHFAPFVLVVSLLGCRYLGQAPDTTSVLVRNQPTEVRYDRILRFAREGRAKGCPKHPRGVSVAERAALKPVAIENGYLRRCERYPERPSSTSTVSGEFEICVHPEGFVYDVHVLRSTGVPGLDDQLIEAAGLWVYDPEVRDGRAVAFCHPMAVVWRAAEGSGAD